MNPNSRLSVEWFTGLKTEEEKEYFRRSIYASRQVLDKLLEIMNKRKASISSVTREDYDSPSWAYKQADRNGALREIESVIKLLTLTNKEA